MKNQEKAEQIKALYEISEAISSEMYIEDVLKLIVTVTAESMGSKICSIMLVDERQQVVKIRATQAMSSAYLKKPPLKIGEGIAGRIAVDGKPVIVEDVRKEDNYKYRDIATRENMVSMLAVPMKVKGKVTGVLSVYTSKKYKFKDRDINILSAIANQAAIIIENTELIVQSKILQEEIEIRKKVERAKGLLMKEQKITEDQAYNKLRRFSMDNRKTMKEVAEAIIMAYKISDREE